MARHVAAKPVKPVRTQPSPEHLPAPSAQTGWDWRSLTPAALIVALFIFAAYSGVIWNNVFGPEFCSFYWWNYNIDFSRLLNTYVYALGKNWYRPTSFNLPYWFFSFFLNWHSIMWWKFAQTLTLIVAALGISWISLLFFPRHRVAAILAACYFAVYPGCYSILLQNSAFDFLHITLVAGTVGCYWIARQSNQGTRWLIASAALYLLALSAKELTIVTPLYLAVISAIGIWQEKSGVPLLVRARREILRLAPFFVLLAAFYVFHVRPMRAFPVDAAYRTAFNPTYVSQNLIKYPFWIVRIFSGTGESQSQTAGHDNLYTHYTGMILLLLVFSQWIWDLRRDRKLRSPFLLLIAWVAVFAMVPVWSGAFLWHINLAMGGYAVLFGIAMERFFHSTRHPRLFTSALIVLLLVLGWAAGRDTIDRGIHALHYKIGRNTLDGPPPVPESQVPKSAVIYYEDRLSLGNWAFGGGDNLFKWRYLRPDIREKSVPPMASVPGPLLAQWLAAPGAFFFVHDDEFHWRDATALFRKFAVEALPGYTNELLTQNRNQEVFDLIDPLLRRKDVFSPSLVYYHHAIAAHRLKRHDAALQSFAKSLELEPRYALAYLNRGYVYIETGRKPEACQDYRKALEFDPKNEGIRRLLSDTCR
jgi:hypothetical protein